TCPAAPSCRAGPGWLTSWCSPRWEMRLGAGARFRGAFVPLAGGVLPSAAAGKHAVGDGGAADIEARGHSHGGAAGGVERGDGRAALPHNLAAVLVHRQPAHGDGGAREFLAAHGNVDGPVGTEPQGFAVTVLLFEAIVAGGGTGIVVGHLRLEASGVDAELLCQLRQGPAAGAVVDR